MGLRASIIATEEQRGHNSDRHNFGVGQVALGIVAMMQSVKHVGTQAIPCYNLTVHDESFPRVKIKHLNSSAFVMDWSR